MSIVVGQFRKLDCAQTKSQSRPEKYQCRSIAVSHGLKSSRKQTTHKLKTEEISIE